MKRTIGLLVGAAALGLLSTHCSDDGGDGNPAPSGGAPAGGAPAGGASAGVAGKAIAGSPPMGGGGATAGTGGSATGGSSAGTAGKAGGGAGMGGASGGSGGSSGGASAGTGGASGGSGGASGGSGGAIAGSGGSGGGSAGTGGSPATFMEVQQIITSKCATAGCHSKGNGQHIELHADGLHGRLTQTGIPSGMGRKCDGTVLVPQGTTSGSTLLYRLVSTTMPTDRPSAPCGGTAMGGEPIPKMPNNCGKGGGPQCLTDAELKTIASWIDGGAMP